MGRTHRALPGSAAAFLIAAAAWFLGPCARSEVAPSYSITVRLSNFAFTPDHLLLRADLPVRLHLVNDSRGGHDFSAPALFAASTFPNGAPPPEGEVDVRSGQAVDVVFVPRVPGTYKVRCTHFLHTFFGMTGSVVVEGPSR